MIRIKDWKKFQHFKDRRPPWVKLYRDLLDDPEWFRLDDASSKTIVMLWLLASEDETQEGVLPPVETIAFRLRMTEKEVKQRLIKLDHWLYQDDIAPISSPVQVGPPETETQVRDRERNIVSLEFEKFKKNYPKRKGSQGWPSAEKHFLSAIRLGTNPNEIIEAARKFAFSVESAVGTEFVPMAETWLRKKCFLEFIPTQEDTEKQARDAEFMRSKGFEWTEGIWKKTDGGEQ